MRRDGGSTRLGLGEQRVRRTMQVQRRQCVCAVRVRALRLRRPRQATLARDANRLH